MAVTRRDAEALDADDELAAFRDRFDLREGPIYVDGNSLGRPPARTRERLEALHEQWAERLVGGWADWIELSPAVGDLLADGVLGARRGEVVVCDSVTVNLFKLAIAALDSARAGAVLTDRANFPTDRYVLAGVAQRAGRSYVEVDEVSAEAVAAVDEEVALVSFSHVDYRSGALADLAGITDAIHERGALGLWDLSHSAGAVEVALEAAGADLAVGCTYKYLDGGPGAPAFLYVRSDLQGELRSPIQGWFGQHEQFAMGPAYDPEPGVARFLAGTPPVAGLVAVQSGAELVAEAGIGRIAAKVRALTALAIEVHDERLASEGFSLLTPREPGRRGAHVALGHPDGWRICRALIERAGVLPDFREPDVVRFGFSPLDTRFVDVFDALDRTGQVARSGGYLELDDARRRVT